MGLIQKLNAVATAISNKTGEPASEYTLDEMPTAIASIQTTPLPQPEPEDIRAVRFIGHDGEVISELTYEQAAELTSLPEGPEVEGLTFIGWTSTIEAVNDVAEPNHLDVGAMYQKTKSYGDATVLTVVPQVNSDKKITLRFAQSEADGVEIDWGDGSEAETIATAGDVTATHTYTETLADRYDIILTPTASCELTLGTNNSTNLFNKTSDTFELKEASIGRAHLSNYVFNYCKTMTACYISPQDQVLPSYAFQNCYSLKSIVIPNSITSISVYAFQYCYGIANIVIPNSVTSIGANAFAYCYGIANIVIPNSVTSINSYAFQNCQALQSIIIPNSVTSINSNAFGYCYAIQSIVFSNSVTSIDGSAFQYCYSLKSIVFPNSVTNIGYSAFQYCQALRSIVISNSVTNISSGAFGYCYALKTVRFGNRTANLPTSSWLNSSDKIEYLDFSECEQIPAATSSNFFTNMPAFTKIVVPDDLYDNWIVAANWSAKASQIVKASEVEDI